MTPANIAEHYKHFLQVHGLGKWGVPHGNTNNSWGNRTSGLEQLSARVANPQELVKKPISAQELVGGLLKAERPGSGPPGSGWHCQALTIPSSSFCISHSAALWVGEVCGSLRPLHCFLSYRCQQRLSNDIPSCVSMNPDLKKKKP